MSKKILLSIFITFLIINSAKGDRLDEMFLLEKWNHIIKILHSFLRQEKRLF